MNVIGAIKFGMRTIEEGLWGNMNFVTRQTTGEIEFVIFLSTERCGTGFCRSGDGDEVWWFGVARNA